MTSYVSGSMSYTRKTGLPLVGVKEPEMKAIPLALSAVRLS